METFDVKVSLFIEFNTSKAEMVVLTIISFISSKPIKLSKSTIKNVTTLVPRILKLDYGFSRDSTQA